MLNLQTRMEIVKSVLVLLIMLSCSMADQPFSVISEISEAYPLPVLNFEYDALEPYIDEATMIVHHTGHHLAYTNKMNFALKEWRASIDRDEIDQKNLAARSILEIIKSIENVPQKWRTTLKNNAGGYINHAIFFSVIGPNPDKVDRFALGKVAEQINRAFGNFSVFKEIFNNAALKLFGSGYVWLCREKRTNTLTVFPSHNQDCPLSYGLEPILVIDVWEHAYYLKHKNKRLHYINDWWKVVNWDSVNQIYDFWQQTQNIHSEL